MEHLDSAIIAAIAALVTTTIATLTTLYHRRKDGPDIQKSLVEATTLLLSQLQSRVLVLETKIEELEGELAQVRMENRMYRDKHGPIGTI